MSKQSSPKPVHISTENIGSSSPTARKDELFQMINLYDLVSNVAPLSMIPTPTQKKAKPYVSKNVKTSSKSPVSEPTIPSEDKIVVEEGSRYKGFEMRNPTKHTGVTENQTEAERITIDKDIQKFVTFVLKEMDSDVVPDVQTSLEKEPSPDGDSSEKVDECVPEQAAHERRSKKKSNYVVNVNYLTSDEEPLTNILALGIDKRLQRRKGKVVMFEDSPSKEIKRKFGGMESTPSRISKGKSLVGPARSWSKVDIPTRKWKAISLQVIMSLRSKRMSKTSFLREDMLQISHMLLCLRLH